MLLERVLDKHRQALDSVVAPQQNIYKYCIHSSWIGLCPSVSDNLIIKLIILHDGFV